MNNKQNKSLFAVIAVIGVLAVTGVVVAYNGVANTVIENCTDCNVGATDLQEVDDVMLSGTRWPHGISADDTSPLTGEVRGATFTSTGAVTFGGAATLSSTLAVTGNTTIGGTLNSFKTSTTTDGVNATLLASESGKFIWFGGTGATTTLPAVTSTGAVFTFSIKTAFGTNAVVASAEGDNINGSLFVNDAIVACSGEDLIEFVADGEEIGDFVQLISDGSNWNIVNSRGETSAKIICEDE